MSERLASSFDQAIRDAARIAAQKEIDDASANPIYVPTKDSPFFTELYIPFAGDVDALAAHHTERLARICRALRPPETPLS